jgi:DNA polymerase elongation subunit (family B)
MHTLVLDIETVGEDWGNLDETTKDVLLRWAKRSAKDEAEFRVLEKDVQEGLGFSPLTGEIVSIALYDVERTRGVVYFQSDKKIPEYEKDGYILRTRSEKEMLKDFWEGAREYDTFVTFNGRGFDIPYIMLRSAIHEISPTQDLMNGRYLYQQKRAKHIDLQDQMTFYGAMHRRPSLHLFTRAFGIESPKEEGVAGDDVSELYKAKKFKEIAEYNARDVVATTKLYKKWKEFLAPQNFLD